MDREIRSPIKVPPGRLPGQSGQEQIDRILDDQILFPLLLASASVAAAVTEWLRWWWKLPPVPWLITFLSAGSIVYGWLRIRKLRPIIQQLRLGIDGERTVAEILDEDLRNAKIIHDILCEGFNVDHVAVDRTGIYSIETKTRRKSGGTDEKVIYDGEKLLVGGFEPDRDAIAQAEMNAKTVSQILFERTGKRVCIQPVVLFPGWYVETRVRRPAVWVLNPRMLKYELKRARNTLSVEEMTILSSALARHQQEFQKELIKTS